MGRMGSEPKTRREFPETQWSRILSLRDPDHPAYARELERLAQQYWKPVFYYVRALRPDSPQEAEDQTQQFFALLLSRGDLEKLSPERGSFRGYLKTALRHFLSSQDRAAQARRPADGRRPIPFPAGLAEAPPQAGVSPEEAFDREWARGVLTEAVGALKDRLKAEGQELPFELFRAYCLEEGDLRYSDLARRHGLSEDDVRNLLRLARQRLRELLRERLRDYLAPGEDVESELRFILSK
jgi:RNA polymerase sigma-70 factor (ECF subfamily)